MNRNGVYDRKAAYYGRQAAYEKRTGAGAAGNSGAYVYGNTVRQAQPEWQEEPEVEERPERQERPGRQVRPERQARPERQERPGRQAQPGRQIQPAIRKNRDKARHMSAGYVLFLAAALCAAAFILVNYIQLQAELTNLTKAVAAGKSELNSLREANDERYNRIINSLDLEEVKRVAIGELGMTYAKEGQIVFYVGAGDDYMRRVAGEDGQR